MSGERSGRDDVPGRWAGAERWAELVTGPESAVALDEACLLVSARLQGCDVDHVDRQRARLDALAGEVTGDGADAVVGHLFRTGAFAGNRDDYLDPANSYLDRVLDRRRGIPISLAVLAVEVGRRRGVRAHAVGLPGHVVLGVGDPVRYVDVFSGGVELDRDACERLAGLVTPPGLPFDPAWLQPLRPFALLVRVLANLRNSFAARGTRRELAAALELRLDLPGAAAAEQLELGKVQAALGRFEAAARTYEAVADRLEVRGGSDDGDRVQALRSRAVAARARLN